MVTMCVAREQENEARGVHEDTDSICRHVVNSQEYRTALARRGMLRSDHEEFNHFMFGGARTFDGDLSRWDVSSVTDMSNMFSYAASFNRPLTSWKVNKVKSFRSFLSSAWSFDSSVKDLVKWLDQSLSSERTERHRDIPLGDLGRVERRERLT